MEKVWIGNDNKDLKEFIRELNIMFKDLKFSGGSPYTEILYYNTEFFRLREARSNLLVDIDDAEHIYEVVSKKEMIDIIGKAYERRNIFTIITDKDFGAKLFNDTSLASQYSYVRGFVFYSAEDKMVWDNSILDYSTIRNGYEQVSNEDFIKIVSMDFLLVEDTTSESEDVFYYKPKDDKDLLQILHQLIQLPVTFEEGGWIIIPFRFTASTDAEASKLPSLPPLISFINNLRVENGVVHFIKEKDYRGYKCKSIKEFVERINSIKPK
jgi:hypothetical protein